LDLKRGSGAQDFFGKDGAGPGEIGEVHAAAQLIGELVGDPEAVDGVRGQCREKGDVDVACS